MRLIVGLGNPGEKYRLTPHNLGFLTIDRLAEDAGIRVSRPEGGALVGTGTLAGEEAVLVKPLSYMNLSGGPAKVVMDKYGLTPADLILIYDDLDLPWSTLRLKPKGSAGGHHGVESVIGSLKTQQFVRLRMGIHPGRPVGDGARYVLRRFSREEVAELEDFVGRAADAVRLVMSDGAEKAMAVANRRAVGQRDEEA